MTPLLLACSLLAAPPAPPGPTDVVYHVHRLGLPATGTLKSLRIAAALPDGTVSGSSEVAPADRRSQPRTIAWAWTGSEFREVKPPFRTRKPDASVYLQRTALDGRITASADDRPFLWVRGVGSEITADPPPGRPADSKGSISADLSPSGLLHASYLPTGKGGATAFLPGDGKPVWLGLTGGRFQLGQDGPRASYVFDAKPDGTIVGESQSFRPGDTSGPFREADGSWVGSSAWLVRDGACLPLTPVGLDADGNPLCKPEFILPDGTLLVRIPSGLGLAADLTVAPLVFKDAPRAASASLALHSPDGTHRVFETRTPGASTLWFQSGGGAPLRLNPPTVKEAAGELVETKPLAIDGSGRVLLSSRRRSASKEAPGTLLWSWQAGKTRLILPDDLPPKDYRGLVDHHRKPHDVASGPITGQQLVRVKPPGPGRTVQPRLHAWVFDPANDAFTMPDFGASVGSTDWETAVEASTRGGTHLMRCTDYGATPPVTSYCLWSAKEGFATLHLASPDGSNIAGAQIVSIEHVLGEDAGVLLATVSGMGARIGTEDVDQFLLSRR